MMKHLLLRLTRASMFALIAFAMAASLGVWRAAGIATLVLLLTARPTARAQDHPHARVAAAFLAFLTAGFAVAMVTILMGTSRPVAVGVVLLSALAASVVAEWWMVGRAAQRQVIAGAMR